MSKAIYIPLFLFFLFQTHTVFAETLNTPDTTTTKVVYLTFDADMNKVIEKRLKSGKVSTWYSRNLVSYLEREHIPATIFVTGMFAELYPSLVRELAQTPGILIGNHTYDHAGFERPCYKMRILSSDQEKKDEIIKTQEILTPLIGYAPKYFRFPGLCDNPRDDQLVQSLGLVVADNGVVSGDAFSKNPKRIAHTVLRHVQDQSVVIMHLGGPNAPSTYIAMKKIVPTLEREGYVFRHL